MAKNAGTADGGTILNKYGNLTIKNCQFINSSIGGRGGAIYNEEGFLTIINSKFINNYANIGSSIYSTRNNTCTIINSKFINNTVERNGIVYLHSNSTILNSEFNNNYGSVLMMTGADLKSRLLPGTVENCTFTNNNVPTSQLSYLTRIKVINCLFENNTSINSGLVSILGSIINNTQFINNNANKGSIINLIQTISQIDNSLFKDNHAINGTIHALDPISITNSIFENNTANIGGCVWTASPINLTNNIFKNNLANYTGVLFLNNTKLSEVARITNCNFTNNKALKSTGTIQIDGVKFDVKINNSTFVDNTADFISTIDNNGNCTINNSYFNGQNSPLIYNLGKVIVDNTFNINESDVENYGILIILNPKSDINNNTVINNTNATPVNLNNNTNTTNITNNDIIITKINVSNFNKIYGTEDKFTGTFTDNNGNPLIGQHINIRLSRTINNQYKDYDVVTDYKGEFNLPINLAPGTYYATVDFNGLIHNNKTYLPTPSNKVNITVNKENTNDNRTESIITLDEFNEPYGAGKSLTGHLTTINNENIIGRHVGILLTRISSGATKTYDTVTDYTGSFNLAINLARGQYRVIAGYNGDMSFTNTLKSMVFTIY